MYTATPPPRRRPGSPPDPTVRSNILIMDAYLPTRRHWWRQHWRTLSHHRGEPAVILDGACCFGNRLSVELPPGWTLPPITLREVRRLLRPDAMCARIGRGRVTATLPRRESEGLAQVVRDLALENMERITS